MNRAPSTQAIQERLRLLVCRHCGWAEALDASLDPTTPRSCEKTCPLFQQLPQLKRTAELLDPMLRNRHVVLRNSIREMAQKACANAGPSNAKRAGPRSFNRRKDHIAKAIGALFRW